MCRPEILESQGPTLFHPLAKGNEEETCLASCESLLFLWLSLMRASSAACTKSGRLDIFFILGSCFFCKISKSPAHSMCGLKLKVLKGVRLGWGGGGGLTDAW